MSSIAELKKKHQDQLSAIFKEFGIFFAFSNAQFDEQKQEGVEYAAGPAGMVIPVKNYKVFCERLDRHSKESKKELRECKGMEKYIDYELSNHEAYYTQSIRVAFEAVKEVYPECTEDDMWRVFNKNNEKS